MDFNEILLRRRAINYFDPDRDVPEDLLRTVLEDAAKAPSSYNLQPWKVKVLRDPKLKATLQELAFNQPKVSEAPVVLMILADREAWKENAANFERQFEALVEAGMYKTEDKEQFLGATSHLYGRNDEAAQAFANKNAGLFAMSLMYAASHHGLHTHPMDGFNHDAVKEKFGIPDQYWIPMLICVGHQKPGMEIHPKGWRFSVDEFTLD